MVFGKNLVILDLIRNEKVEFANRKRSIVFKYPSILVYEYILNWTTLS